MFSGKLFFVFCSVFGSDFEDNDGVNTLGFDLVLFEPISTLL